MDPEHGIFTDGQVLVLRDLSLYLLDPPNETLCIAAATDIVIVSHMLLNLKQGFRQAALELIPREQNDIN